MPSGGDVPPSPWPAEGCRGRAGNVSTSPSITYGPGLTGGGGSVPWSSAGAAAGSSAGAGFLPTAWVPAGTLTNLFPPGAGADAGTRSAAQAVAVIRELEIEPDKVNPNGGAIALGHPVGATGAILTVKLAHELKRRQAEWGIVTMCIGGGQGIATLFRNPN